MAGAYEESRKNSPSALPSYGAYKESRKGSPSALASNNPKKSKSVKPKNPDRSIKVSQSEINQIKKLGMKKSLEIAAGNRGSTYSGAVASFGEGVRRLYGETRYQNAVYTPKASPGPVASNFTYQTGQSSNKASMASKPKAKSKNVAGFKPGSVGAKFMTAFKNTGK